MTFIKANKTNSFGIWESDFKDKFIKSTAFWLASVGVVTRCFLCFNYVTSCYLVPAVFR